MDTSKIQLSSTEVQFSDKLVAVPTLELIGHCSKDEITSLLATLNAWMLSAALFPAEIEVATLITHEQGMNEHVGVVDDVLLDALRSEFVDASSRPIRMQPVTILLNCKRDANPIRACAVSARLTVGDNFFPDDPITISICLRSSDPTAWTDLNKARKVISSMLEQKLLYSTFGYGFTCDFEQVMEVSPAMENLCMRYLGVDLNDPFGNYAFYMPRGFRSINWQIGIPERRLSSLGPAQSKTLLACTTLEDGVRYWKTGEKPSICDRNSTIDHQAIAEYAALDRQLKSLKFMPSVLWMPKWRSDTYERWQNRWEEVSF
ncbi:hypothetical protein [Massilia rubra]|uniref:Uncharacterized protein n=1 Tax=Massilia rubra TaxID=2607910 RepID=A0ABX0LYI9_9BURK|nr:hypothetical protein [Massilia rubra]NHZ37803.1 hypothetical protein [Massilia rubra]